MDETLAEAELQALGSMMHGKEACVKVTQMLTPDDFFDATNRTIAEVCWKTFSEGRVPNMSDLIISRRVSAADAHRAGTTAFTGAYAEHYAQLVLDASSCRKLLEGYRLASEAAAEGKADAAIELGQKALLGIGRSRNPRPIRTAAEGVAEVLEAAANYGKTGKGPGLRTGFADYDYLTGGLRPGEFTVLAGDVGMGKTSCALGMANGLAANGHRVGIVSMEMPLCTLVGRLLAMESGLEQRLLEDGTVTPEQMARFQAAGKRLSDRGIFFEEAPALTIAQLRADIQGMVINHSIEAVFVDLLGRVTSPGARNREQEMSQIAYGCKLLAMELKIPVVGLCQFNRQVDRETDKIPRMAHLRDSGDIAAAADVVTLLYRPDHYDVNTERKGLVDLLVVKHRNGPTSTVTMGWMAKTTKLVNLTGKAAPAGKEEGF